jgi:hypothetical protein
VACIGAAGTGCALGRLTALREIVWEGEVTVRGSFVVAVDERLVIRPGTRVLFAFGDGDGAGDARIVVKGAIEARGTEAAPIEFAPERPVERGRAGWSEVLVEDAVQAAFAHCRFTGARQAVHSHRTPLVVESCRFEHNGFGIRFTGGPVVIRWSRFDANETAVRYWASSPELTENEFNGNGTAVFVREGSPRSVLAGNDFVASTDYHVKLGELQAADVEARGNWWGTVRPEEIERLIYDREDAEYLGRVRYDPPATAPRRTVSTGQGR